MIEAGSANFSRAVLICVFLERLIDREISSHSAKDRDREPQCPPKGYALSDSERRNPKKHPDTNFSPYPPRPGNPMADAQFCQQPEAGDEDDKHCCSMCHAEEFSPAVGNARTVIGGLEPESPQRKNKQQDAKDVNELVCFVADHDRKLRTLDARGFIFPPAQRISVSFLFCLMTSDEISKKIHRRIGFKSP
jgi:hypothetical protein